MALACRLAPAAAAAVGRRHLPVLCRAASAKAAAPDATELGQWAGMGRR